MTDEEKMIALVSQCQDSEQLRNIRKNALKRGADKLADVAFRRLVSLAPAEAPGSVEHDFWQTIHAFELILTEERGKATRLSRTRQKVARVGVVQTLRDWATSSKETDGFQMLLARGMPELTGEAIVMRHGQHFGGPVVSAARARLEKAGVSLTSLPQ